jgi:hypothetical protein
MLTIKIELFQIKNPRALLHKKVGDTTLCHRAETQEIA